MLKATPHLLKSPVVYKQGNGVISHQLRRLFEKKDVSRYVFRWPSVPEYPMQKMVHVNRRLCPRTGRANYADPHWTARAKYVPDQTLAKVPCPPEFMDAYWKRERAARRLQLPFDEMQDKIYKRDERRQTDFQDLAYRPKKQFTIEEVLEHARMELR